MKKAFLLSGFIILFIAGASGQIAFKVGEESTMSITGTSTIHDWTSTVKEIKGTYVFKENVTDNKIPKSGSIVDQVIMEIPVLSIESPRGTTMDNKTYNALKSEEHPNIIFKVTEDKIKNASGTNPETFQLDVSGSLTIAGHTKTIALTLDGQKPAPNTLTFKGSFPIDMVSYEIDPPSAMFGQIKTGKDVTIDFELTLVK